MKYVVNYCMTSINIDNNHLVSNQSHSIYVFNLWYLILELVDVHLISDKQSIALYFKVSNYLTL